MHYKQQIKIIFIDNEMLCFESLNFYFTELWKRNTYKHVLPWEFWKERDVDVHTQDIPLHDLQYYAVQIPLHLKEKGTKDNYAIQL